LPVELRNEINALLMDTRQSRRDFMAIALKKQVADYEIARMQGYNEGFAIGYKKGRIGGSIFHVICVVSWFIFQQILIVKKL